MSEVNFGEDEVKLELDLNKETRKFSDEILLLSQLKVDKETRENLITQRTELFELHMKDLKKKAENNLVISDNLNFIHSCIHEVTHDNFTITDENFHRVLFICHAVSRFFVYRSKLINDKININCSERLNKTYKELEYIEEVINNEGTNLDDFKSILTNQVIKIISTYQNVIQNEELSEILFKGDNNE